MTTGARVPLLPYVQLDGGLSTSVRMRNCLGLRCSPEIEEAGDFHADLAASEAAMLCKSAAVQLNDCRSLALLYKKLSLVANQAMARCVLVHWQVQLSCDEFRCVISSSCKHLVFHP